MRLGATLLLVHFLIFDGGNRSRYDFDFAVASQILAIVTVGGWLLSLAIARRSFPRTVLDGPIGLFFIAAALSLAFAQDRRVSLEAMPPLLASVLLFYLLVDLWRAGRGPEIVPSLVIVGSFVPLLSLIEYLAWYGGLLPVPLRSGDGSWLSVAGWAGILPSASHRPIFAVNANHLAAVLALGIPFLVGRLLAGPTRRGRALALLALALVCVPFLLTLSRGGLLAGLVAISSTLVLTLLATGRPVRSPRRRLLTLMGVVGGLLAGLAGALVATGFQAGLVGNWLRPETLTNRLPFWGAAIDLLARHPLAGVGPGGFGLALAGYAAQWPDLHRVQLAHNGLLQIGAELGGIGILAAGWLIGTLILVFHRRWRASRGGERLGLVPIGGALIGFLAANVFDAYFTFQLVMIPVTILVVMLVAPVAPVTSSPAQAGRALAAAQLWKERRAFARPDRRTQLKPAEIGDPATTAPYRLPLAVLAGCGAILVVVSINHAWAAFAQARLAASSGQWRQAERDLERAAARDPSFPFYFSQLGLVRGFLAEEAALSPAEQRARATWAAAAYQQGRPLAQPTDLLNEARLQELAGDLTAAVETAQAAVERSPWDPLPLLNWGRWLELTGDRSGAIAAYSRAIARAPELRRAEFWLETEDRPMLLPRIDDAVQMTLATDPTLSELEADLRRAEVAAYAGRRTLAESWLSHLPRDHPRAAFLHGWMAEEAGADAEALVAFERAYQHRPPRDEIAVARIAAAYAAQLAKAGRIAEAERILRLARFYLVDPEIEYRTAQVARAAGDADRALAAYQASLATTVLHREHFAPNALSRPAILPSTLPGLILPAPTADANRRARELAAYRESLAVVAHDDPLATRSRQAGP